MNWYLILEFYVGDKKTWINAKNKGERDCNSFPSCNGSLVFETSNEQMYLYGYMTRSTGDTIDLKSDKDCAIWDEGKIDGKDCTNENYFACRLKCYPGILIILYFSNA